MPAPNPDGAPPQHPFAAVVDGGDQQQAIDASHLKVLSICYWIFGGLSFLGTCGGVFYMGMGIVFMASPPSDLNPDEARIAAILFIGLGIFITILTLVVGGLLLANGFALKSRTAYIRCLIVAGLACLSIPLGTILGVFTFVVLSRPSVKRAFGRS
ncbi:MAG: hypothetical protein ACYTF9_13595 [Planctomycetota bacterium]|jgi:hypothetical protein